jgi:large subunit ribosomal protein L35
LTPRPALWRDFPVKNYKLKTHKGTAKRIHVTAGGKFTHNKMGRNHLRRHNTGRISRALDKTSQLTPGNARKMTRLLPYV